MEQQKEYYAFISYKREDEKWAKWLQDKLEHYKFPTNLNGRNDLPKNIRPTFRDVTDLKPGLLAEEINNALVNSEWLIIVCSPRSAKSPWVCKEAQTFIDFGRSDHIIPFVVEGNPFSDDTSTECYPEALLNLTGSKELLAANINEMGRDAAAIKVVARMFNLRFDSLWQRYEREQKRKKWLWIIGSMLIALLGLGIGGYFVKQNKTIETQKERLQTDSLIMANHIERIQNDSVLLSLQKDSILKTYTLLETANKNLERSNNSLRLANDSIKRQYALIEQQKNEIERERDNVNKANDSLRVILSRMLAEKSIKLTDEGDSYMARLIALQALPPYLPYTPEAEAALRHAMKKEDAILWGHSGLVNTASFSPDGSRIVTASYDGTARIWDAQSGALIKVFDYNYSAWSATYSPDGNRIMIVADGNVDIYDAQNGTHIVTISSLSYDATYSPDGSKILTRGLNDVNVWDAESGSLIKTFRTKKPVNFAAFIFDGRSVLTAEGRTIRLWDIEYENCKDSIIIEFKDRYLINSKLITISPDGKCMAMVTGSNVIQIWDLNLKTCIDTLSFDEVGSINSITYDRYGNIVSAHTDGSICKFYIGMKEYFVEARLSVNPVCAVETPDYNRIMVICGDGSIRIVDDIFYTRSMLVYDSSLLEISFPRLESRPVEDAFLLITGDSLIMLSNKANYKAQKILKMPEKKILTATFTPDGKKIMSLSDNGYIFSVIRCWDALNGNCIDSSYIHASISIYASSSFRYAGLPYASFCSNGNRIVTYSSLYRVVQIWDTHNGQLVNSFSLLGKKGQNFRSLNSLNPDGTRLLFVKEPRRDSIMIWNTDSGLFEKTFSGHLGEVSYASFSPDGKQIVSASADRTLRVWDIVSGKCLHVLMGHTARVKTAAYSPDGRYIVSVSNDETVRVWDARTGICLDVIQTHTEPNQATFNATGDEIEITCDGFEDSSFSFAFVKFMSLNKLIEQARAQMNNRTLTSDEKKRYYLE